MDILQYQFLDLDDKTKGIANQELLDKILFLKMALGYSLPLREREFFHLLYFQLHVYL